MVEDCKNEKKEYVQIPVALLKFAWNYSKTIKSKKHVENFGKCLFD